MDRYSTLRNGLVGAWCPSLGESGYVVRDRSGRGNNATLNSGVSHVARQGGTALNFNGSSGIATLGKASFVGLTTMTVTYWFRRSATTQIFGMQQGSAETSRIFFASASDNNVYVGGITATASRFSFASLSAFSLNQWHHFVGTLVVNQATSAAGHRIWINGVQQSVSHFGTGSLASIPAFTTFAEIGERFTGSGTEYRNCDHDDIRIYSRELTLAEIRLLASQRGIGLLPTRHRRGSALSQFWTNVSGTWKTATPWINVGGTWKKATPKLRTGGTWKG